MGKHTKRLMLFALTYPYNWHSYSTDTVTTRAINALRRDGLLITNEFRQFRLNIPERYFVAMQQCVEKGR